MCIRQTLLLYQELKHKQTEMLTNRKQKNRLGRQLRCGMGWVLGRLSLTLLQTEIQLDRTVFVPLFRSSHTKIWFFEFVT